MRKLSWMPDLSQHKGPRYLAVADKLGEDIVAGRLTEGTKLPPQRDLAYALNVSLGTITRAYIEGERRGLLHGEVGRGTFVRASPPPLAGLAAPLDVIPGSNHIDLSVNYPVAEGAITRMQQALEHLSRQDLTPIISYVPNAGLKRHRQSGHQLLKKRGIPHDIEQVLVTTGATQALYASLAALTRPGDLVLTEAFTYPGMKAIANQLSVRLSGLAMDEYGVTPVALERACQNGEAKALYIVPNLQNPTVAIMSMERRQEIVSIARRHQLMIIEDDVYAWHLEKPLPPLASLYPERTFYIAGLSKCGAPALRIAFALVPPNLEGRAITAIRATSWMAPPLMAEIACDWLDQGVFDDMAVYVRNQAIIRQKKVSQYLGHHKIFRHETSLHVWLPLPEPWREQEFVQALRQRGVLVSPSEFFVVGRGTATHAVRICLGQESNLHRLEQGLITIAQLLDSNSEYDTDEAAISVI